MARKLLKNGFLAIRLGCRSIKNFSDERQLPIDSVSPLNSSYWQNQSDRGGLPRRGRELLPCDHQAYCLSELGANYFDTLDRERLRKHTVKRLEALGYEVTLTPKEVGA